MPSTPRASALRASSQMRSIEPRSRHGWPTISPTYGKNLIDVPSRIFWIGSMMVPPIR